MGELVEGIGDEVLFFVGFLVLSVVGLGYLSCRGRTPRAQEARRSEGQSEQHSSASAPQNDTPAAPTATVGSEDSTLRSRAHAQSQQVQSETKPSPQGVAAGNEQSNEDDSISVKLIVGESSRIISTCRQATLDDLRNQHFPAEVAENRLVHFIFQGRILENSSLSQLNITNNCSLHVHIGRPNSMQNQNNRNLQQEPEVFDISQLFIPLIGLILAIVWVGMLCYPAVFSFASKLLLFALSLGYVFLTYFTISQ